MKNMHIAFISYPQHPHIGPVLPIISVLVRRGYRVTCVTSDQFSSRVESLGAEVFPCPRIPTLSSDEQQDSIEKNPTVELAVASLNAVEAWYEKQRPALILYDYAALVGRILAHRWEIPAVKTSPMFSQDRRNHCTQVKDGAFRQAIINYGAQIDQFMEQVGIPDANWVFHKERLNMYMFPQVLQPCPDLADDRLFYAGRCAGEQPYYGSWQKKSADGKPIIFVVTSTHYVRGPDYFKMCIEALSGMNFHVILSIGDSGDPRAFGTLPADVEIVQHTSHVKVMPHVSLLICLGGIVTSAEAAYYGVPMLVTTHGFPELEWEADNLVNVGVAKHLRKLDMNADSIRAAASEILRDRVMRDRVDQVRRVTRGASGAEEVANRLEGYLQAYRSARSPDAYTG